MSDGKLFKITTRKPSVYEYPLQGVALIWADDEQEALKEAKELWVMYKFRDDSDLLIEEICLGLGPNIAFSGLVIETIRDCD